jgi:hypothetical protein
MRHRRPIAAWLGVLAVGFLAQASQAADSALHEQIDRAIESGRDGRLAPPATDGEFLRRVSLDLVGMIPTAADARAFLDDPSPYKRQRWIDRLLESPEFARRMQIVFDVMLMERRPDTNVARAEWERFLLEAFRENRPFNQVVRQILEADGSDPAHRGPAKFYLDRDGDAYTLTRDVGRLFLGRDMQCAQCHDHVLYDDYKQAHYYGLYAFFSRSYSIQDGRGVASFAEKADGDVTFKSVFKKKVTHGTGPRLIDGPPVTEQAVAKGQEYWVAPSDKVQSIPRNSRRALLGPLLASGQVPEFNRNIVNRLWALMMGRGLVHPLDLHHGDNPPSHPELLDSLAREFVAGGYNVKSFLRELALTRTYARSSEPPPGLSPEDTAPERFTVALLKPLSPEQMAWSVMQATGNVTGVRADVEHRRIALDPKFRDLMQTDAKREQLGRDLVEDEVYERLKGNAGPFVSQFGRAPGQAQDVSDSTVHQALFLANGQPVQAWVSGLANRLAAITDGGALTDELYLAVLTRRPTSGEREEAAQYLAKRGQERTPAVGELAWALLTSTEFRFNH